jgi:hypothetical protein
MILPERSPTNAFLLILWSGGISYVRPFFPPQARKERVPGGPGFWRNGRVEFSFLAYTISKTPTSQRSHGWFRCARAPNEKDVDGRVVI